MAQHEIREGILETTYLELLNTDLAFVCAMLPDDSPTAISNVIKRLGRNLGMRPNTAGGSLRKTPSKSMAEGGDRV